LNARIKIKMGSIEIDYEGSEEFLKKEFREFLTAVIELRSQSAGEEIAQASSEGAPPGSSGTSVRTTTKTICSRLGGKSGSELAFAACAKLTIVDSLAEFDRKQIIKEMRSATGIFKEGFATGNLSGYLTSLVRKGKLNEVGQERYSLTEDAERDVRNRIQSK
jgi:hypothetical protein